ncbi:MAG: SusC/RagA family TonB-linked outer membrane protein [Dysgonamonadaceae bacterium]|nr:SusC/RagA family TonB-linked outer membrane protein [Dysgonamonadaceae bacterium]
MKHLIYTRHLIYRKCRAIHTAAFFRFSAMTVALLLSAWNLPAQKLPVLLGEQDSITRIQSISAVSGDRLLHRPTFQMEGFLDGTLPGLYVNMTQGYTTNQASLLMRRRTLLIVVDGIPRSDANIPASQIETLSIIKDGLGLAAWGMSSGDGVLYIKTKRGDVSGMKIDFTAQVSNASQIFRPKFLDAYSYASLLNQALINDGGVPLYTEDDLTLYQNGKNPYTHPNVDWYDVLMRNNAPIQQYNLNLSGGTVDAQYFIDLNVFDQQGFLKQDKSLNAYDTRENFKKYSLRTNVDIRITDRTLFHVNVFGQMFRENTPGKTMMGDIYKALHTTPNNAYPIRNLPADVNGFGVMEETYGGNINYTNNLYAQSLESGYTMYPKTDFNFDLILEHQFSNSLKGLYVKGLYSYNSSYRENMKRTKGYDIWEYSRPDNADPAIPENDPRYYTKRLSAATPANATEYSRVNRLQYLELSTGYHFAIGKSHSNTKLSYWSNEYVLKSENLPMYKEGFNIHSEYDFDKRYLAEVSLSTMRLNFLKPGQQWGFFPAAGLGWNIAAEDFFPASAVNVLKLRTTYGLNGNDGTGYFFRSGTGNMTDYYFTYIKRYKDGSNVTLGQTAAGLKTLVESGLPFVSQWEKSKRWVVGLDMETADKTLSATLEYFNNHHFDILQVNSSKNNNGLIGIDSPKENIGAYRLQGVEVDVAYGKQFGNFSLQTQAHATFYYSEVLANGEPVFPESYMQRVGARHGATFGYVADGLFQTNEEIADYLQHYTVDGYIPQPGDLKYQDLNGDYIIDGRDIREITTRAPRIEYGLYLSAGWKGLELSMQWSGLANSENIINDLPFAINASDAYGQAWEDHLDYWRPDNPQASYPRVSASGNSYNERTSTFWLKNTGYLRLKNVELSYSLPAKWVSAIHLSGVKFFVGAYNVLTLSSLKDRDPELINYSNDTSGIAPNIKAYNFGLNVQF